MIKSVFALVVLLHLCYNAEVNFNLSVEIIGGLEQLIKLNQENKVNITSVSIHTLFDLMLSCVSCWILHSSWLFHHLSIKEVTITKYINDITFCSYSLANCERQGQNMWWVLYLNLSWVSIQEACTLLTMSFDFSTAVFLYWRLHQGAEATAQQC